MQISNTENLKGFTLVETIVAVGIFTVVMMVAIGSLVVTNSNHKISRNIKSLVDNVNYSMEDMSRNIRTGSNIFCIPGYFPYYDELPEVIYDGAVGAYTPADCATLASSGGGVIFESADGDGADPLDQYGYAVFYSTEDDRARLYKTVDGGQTWVSMTPKEVNVDYSRSGFTVVGSAEGDEDNAQTYVSIRMDGEILYKNESTNFSVQTGATLRLLDI